MTRHPLARWVTFEVTIASVLCLYFSTYAIPKAWRTLNTDFPNYYVTARMAHEGVDITRAYEWMWIEREKDHRDVPQRVIGLVPITPFSTLLVMPLSGLSPLTAKHVWTIFNLLLLVGTGWLLARVSGLSLLQTAILIGLSLPLQRNLLYGQYYIVLLAALTAALSCAQQGRRWMAGALVGFAAALKIFPILLMFYFLRKRDWRGIAACLATIVACVLLSVKLLGIGINRTYLQQVLPSALRGDCLPPFNLASSSFSTVLHRLFVYEPQWNPHPALQAAWLFPVLHPILQLLMLLPAVLLINRDCKERERTALEWSGLLLVALAISPLPASYHFTVLLLPVAVMCGYLLRIRNHRLMWFAVGSFLAVGLPSWHIQPREGWGTLLCVPRLYVLIGLSALAFYLLARGRKTAHRSEEAWWIASLAAIAALSILTGVRHQRRASEEFSYRLPMSNETLMAAYPTPFIQDDVGSIALTEAGYRAQTSSGTPILQPRSAEEDQLSLAGGHDQLITEEVTTSSTLHWSTGEALGIDGAESPLLSPDGHRIAYLRTVRGRKQLFERDMPTRGRVERQITTEPMNVSEAAYTIDGSFVLAATSGSSRPTLYSLSREGEMKKLAVGEARYPSVSQDGKWLAFSGFINGNWNLFMLDLRTGERSRLTDAPCNQMQPAWEADSKTLLYATDCGRALWFTAIARRTFLH